MPPSLPVSAPWACWALPVARTMALTLGFPQPLLPSSRGLGWLRPYCLLRCLPRTPAPPLWVAHCE